MAKNYCLVVKIRNAVVDESYLFIGDDKTNEAGEKAEKKFKELVEQSVGGFVDGELMDQYIENGYYEIENGDVGSSICITWPNVEN